MAIDLDVYRKQSRETWGQMAAGWEHRREWLMAVTGPVNDWLLDKTRAQPGQTILELAAGTGDLGFRIAERVGRSAPQRRATRPVMVVHVHRERLLVADEEGGPAVARPLVRLRQAEAELADPVEGGHRASTYSPHPGRCASSS